MEWYPIVKHLHLLSVAISIGLFVVRYWWQYRKSTLLERPWVRIVPHVNDSFLLLTGVTLVTLSGFYSFTRTEWLTDKLFGVIIYIILGFIVLGRGPRSQQVRLFFFLLALVVLYIIIKLATTKIPLLG